MMRRFMNKLKDRPTVHEFYANTNWICEVRYKSTEPNCKDICLQSNVRLVGKPRSDNPAQTDDIIFMRDSSVNMDIWPATFLSSVFKSEMGPHDYLKLAK